MAKVEAALKHNDVDEDRLIEERRRRRQEILAKHQQEAGNGAGQCFSNCTARLDCCCSLTSSSSSHSSPESTAVCVSMPRGCMLHIVFNRPVPMLVVVA